MPDDGGAQVADMKWLCDVWRTELDENRLRLPLRQHISCRIGGQYLAEQAILVQLKNRTGWAETCCDRAVAEQRLPAVGVDVLAKRDVAQVQFRLAGGAGFKFEQNVL